MSLEVIIIHEIGEPGHYTGLAAALDDSVAIRYVEFSTPLLLYRAIKKRDLSRFVKAIFDFFYIIKCTIFPSTLALKNVVLGIAPLDARLLFLRRAVSKANVIYHTSWTDWSGSFYPRASRFKKFESVWRKFLTDVPVVAAVTVAASTSIKLHWPPNDDRLEVVYHSYDPTIFFADRQQTDRNTLSAIYVGRLVREKGVATVLALAKELPWLRVKVVGDGPLREEVERAAATYHNLSYIGYVSSRTELARLYRDSDVVLQPSIRTDEWEELFGMALIEAMACGCVPLTTAHTGPSLILDQSELSGFCLIDESNYRAVAAGRLAQLRVGELIRCRYRRICIERARQFELPAIASRWRRAMQKANFTTAGQDDR